MFILPIMSIMYKVKLQSIYYNIYIWLGDSNLIFKFYL